MKNLKFKNIESLKRTPSNASSRPEKSDLRKLDFFGRLSVVIGVMGLLAGVTASVLVGSEKKTPAGQAGKAPAPAGEVISPGTEEGALAGFDEVKSGMPDSGGTVLTGAKASQTSSPAALDVTSLVENSGGEAAPASVVSIEESGAAPDAEAAAPLMVGPPLPKENIPFPSRQVEAPQEGRTPLLEKVKQAVVESPAKDEATAGEPTMGEENGGFWLRGARLNDVFQYLARLGGLQFFHNSDLEDPQYVVTGHLGDGDPVSQMEELGLMYGVTVHQKGNTVYALTETQLSRMPTKPFQYHLKYLRPADIDQIKTILQPVLSAGSGTVDYEVKTNTLIVIDNEQKIEAIKEVLAEMDKPKQQIAIETRILRIKSSSRNRIGVDWETVLGDGMTVQASQMLNALFNLPDSDKITEVVTVRTDSQGRQGFTVASAGTLSGFPRNANTSVSVSSQVPESTTKLDLAGTVAGIGSISGFAAERGGTRGSFEGFERIQSVASTGTPLVLSPLQLQATVRALNTGGLAQQESSPTLITEDNESGIISIIDRVPIIITTVTETVSGQNISEEVRYKIDLDDPVGDAKTTREIGITVAVTPTILPDGTIRMSLRPRSAQVVEFVEGKSGNLFPRVNESTVDTIARVPNGHSLLIGGFYEEAEFDHTKKVPILGDIPVVNFAFKSTDKEKENTSLIFVVTPRLYEPVSIPETQEMTRGLHDRHVLPLDHKWPDREHPGFNYESNLGWTVGNILNAYPEVPPTNPVNPDHPDNLFGPAEALPAAETERISPYSRQAELPEKRGVFRGLFNKNNR